MQSFPPVIDYPDLDDMGQKELGTLIEKLTGRVTALEKKRASPSPKTEKWGADRWIAFGILVFTIIGVPIMLGSWIESHLHNDLKSDVKNEVTDQLKEPLKQIGEIAGDVKEIKGKLEVLDPLIRELTIKRIGAAGSLNSRDLIAQLPELKHLATIAKQENITIKPETVERVGNKLIEAGSADAWSAALDFLSLKSFLNEKLNELKVAPHTITTIYTLNHVPGFSMPQVFVSGGGVPKEQSAQLRLMDRPDFNSSAQRGDEWIAAEGGSIVLDGMYIKKVIFRNVYISYAGGPLEMQNVYFINCTFAVEQVQNGQRLATTVLKPPPSVNFKTS